MHFGSAIRFRQILQKLPHGSYGEVNRLFGLNAIDEIESEAKSMRDTYRGREEWEQKKTYVLTIFSN